MSDTSKRPFEEGPSSKEMQVSAQKHREMAKQSVVFLQSRHIVLVRESFLQHER